MKPINVDEKKLRKNLAKIYKDYINDKPEAAEEAKSADGPWSGAFLLSKDIETAINNLTSLYTEPCLPKTKAKEILENLLEHSKQSAIKMHHDAGAIIKNNEGKFLVIKGKTGCWGFPKGHIKRGEKIEAAAKREAREEVGLNVKLSAVSKSIEYPLEKGRKRIQFFLAETNSKTVKPNSEVKDYKWLAKEEVMKILSFDDLKELFCEITKK
jgi:8-oxo-dGTP pyrophosphatase MutT (NUDIX family)